MTLWGYYETVSPMEKSARELLVPSSYARIVARELGLQERDLPKLLVGTGLAKSILLPGDRSRVSAEQQMRLLENALRISARPEFGLGLGRRLQPASHGSMGYLVLSSPDVSSALEAFANFLDSKDNASIFSTTEWSDDFSMRISYQF